MSKSLKQIIVPERKPLDAKLLNDIALSFQKNGFGINLFDEFLIFMRIIPELDGERNINECMKELFGEIEFNSKDEFQVFSETYTLFYNSTVHLLDEMEDMKDEHDPNLDILIQLVRSLLMNSGYTEKKAANIICDGLIDRIDFIMEIAGIYPSKPKNLLAQIEKKIGEDYVHILDILATGVDSVKKKKSSNEKNIEGFLAIIFSSLFFNIMRKESYSDNEPQFTTDIISTSSQVGRNDPCPCGSGKKYKKCCFEKYQNPLSVLDPITLQHERLTDEEINQFYEAYDRFVNFARSAYMKDKSETPFFTIAPNGKTACNPFFLQQPEQVEKLHQIITKNKKAIVSEYIKSKKPAKEIESIIRNWNKVIYSEFFIMEKSSCGGAFFWDTEKDIVYHVYGLYDDITSILPPLPVMAGVLLLPFKDRIIYSGILSSTNIQIGKFMARELNAQYVKLRQEKPVIMEL